MEVSVPPSVRNEAITGRVYVMIAKTNDREPRLQIGRTGTPFFGRDVDMLPPGRAAILDQSDLGTPVASLKDIPPGEYFVQGFVNVYSEFKRADGRTVWMHDDQWEGQHWNVSPGNFYSAPQRVQIGPATETIKLVADQKIPAVTVPADSAWVKRFKIQSALLTKFWGRPIYLGATVLLPRDYETSTVRYPILYRQGHFSLAPPLGFEEGSPLHKEWIRDDFPRMIVVTLQHPTPYFDDSYAVNSVNNGPYGDAIMQELVPEIEKRFRVIGEPWARITDGGSTGGWISLAHQILYPDFYGGVWSYCPDSVTFTDVEGINVYKDDNAFYRTVDWRTVPIINTREINGHVRLTSEQRNHMELVNGTKGRSGEQLDIWSAVFGPVGEGRLLRAAVRQAHGHDQSHGRRVLARALRSARIPEAALVDGRPEARRQGPCLHRDDGQLLFEQLDERARGVDEDDGESALHGLLPVRRRQGSLLAGTGIDTGAAPSDGRTHRASQARGHDDAVVAVLTLKGLGTRD